VTLPTAILLGLLGSAPAAAQGAAPLGYEDCLQRALEGNIAFQRAGLDVESADGALLAAKATFDPMLTAGASSFSRTGESFSQFGEVLENTRRQNWNVGLSQYIPTGTTVNLTWDWSRFQTDFTLVDNNIEIESEDPFFQPNLNVSLTQEILQGFRLANNLGGVRRAERARDAAEARLLVQRQQTLEDVARAYWNLYHQRDLVEIAQWSVDTAKEEQRVVAAKVAEGTLAASEQARVDALVVQAESALVDARIAEQTARDLLLVAIGMPLGGDVQLTSEPADPLPVAVDVDGAVAAAMERNPELQALRLMEDNSALDVVMAKHSLLPQLTANASYGQNGFEEGDGAAAVSEAFSNKLPTWTLGATLTMPLLNRADRGALDSTEATAAQMRLDRVAWERSLDQQVRAQVAQIDASKAQISLREANLRLAEETLAAQKALQDAGRVIQKDVLDAMREVENAKVLLLRARADYQVAILSLERLKGTL
jgi:outer membrane protein TolC